MHKTVSYQSSKVRETFGTTSPIASSCHTQTASHTEQLLEDDTGRGLRGQCDLAVVTPE